ncbi:unnamed protein product [Lupinus luteus]|uniref:Uncharacterized protein n=1 Tax=Lupinus luteus TaxID=3873 RepID=A0AAV1XJ70_LUPLU
METKLKEKVTKRNVASLCPRTASPCCLVVVKLTQAVIVTFHLNIILERASSSEIFHLLDGPTTSLTLTTSSATSDDRLLFYKTGGNLTSQDLSGNQGLTIVGP